MDYDDIEVGDVLYLYCGHCTPPKLKYFVVVTVIPEPILLFINSELNSYVNTHSYLLPCHILIERSDNNFLKRDSWVNCCEPCHEFTIDNIERDLKYGGKCCGSLTRNGILNIIAGVKSSPVMKRKIKKRILESLI